MNSKYKVGDIVKVRQDLVGKRNYGGWYPQITGLESVTIMYKEDDWYRVDSNQGVSSFVTDEMLDGLVEQTVEPTNREIMDKLLEIEDRFKQFSIQFGFKFTNSERGWERQDELELLVEELLGGRLK